MCCSVLCELCVAVCVPTQQQQVDSDDGLSLVRQRRVSAPPQDEAVVPPGGAAGCRAADRHDVGSEMCEELLEVSLLLI